MMKKRSTAVSTKKQEKKIESKEARAEVHFLRGNQLYTEDRLEDAYVEMRAAAALGHANAMHNVGVALKDGLGEPQNVAEAHDWFKRAAEAGSVLAMHNYAMNLFVGVPEADVTPDRAEAMRYMLKAAEGGDADAMNIVGI